MDTAISTKELFGSAAFIIRLFRIPWWEKHSLLVFSCRFCVLVMFSKHSGGKKNICFIRRKNKSWLGRTFGNASANSTVTVSFCSLFMFASQSTTLFVYVSVWGRHKTKKDTCHIGTPGNKGVRGRGRYYVAFIFVQSPCSKEPSCEPKVPLSDCMPLQSG